MARSSDGTPDLKESYAPGGTNTKELTIIHALYGDRVGAFTVDMRKVKRIAQLIDEQTRLAEDEGIKRGFYAGQAMAGVELYDCHDNWKKWNLPEDKEAERST